MDSERQAAVLAIAFVVAGVLTLPVLLGYYRILQGTYGYSRSIGEIRTFSADVAGLLFATNESLAWGWVHYISKPESNLFPGLTIVAIAAFVLFHTRALGGLATDTKTMRRSRVAIGIAAVLAVIGTIVPLAMGSWRLTVGGVRLLSIARGDKPAMLALIAGLAWVGMLPRVRAAYGRRSPLAFYLFAAFAMWLFALGPDPTFLDQLRCTRRRMDG